MMKAYNGIKVGVLETFMWLEERGEKRERGREGGREVGTGDREV